MKKLTLLIFTISLTVLSCKKSDDPKTGACTYESACEIKTLADCAYGMYGHNFYEGKTCPEVNYCDPRENGLWKEGSCSTY